MDTDAIISKLEDEWRFDGGFFGRLRNGDFDAQAFSRLIVVLDGISLQDEMALNRRMVSLLWFMPLFMRWQRERVQESGCDMEQFDRASNCVETGVIKLLGVP